MATADINRKLTNNQGDSQRDLYLTFHLHDEDYGLPIAKVTEIVGIQKITWIPDLPECIKGVINLRGRVIPVMDVRLRFRVPLCDYDDRTCVIVVEVGGQTTGLVVDRVNEVVEITPANIEPPPLSATQGYIRGLGKIGEAVKILLDIDNLITADKTLNEIAAEPQQGVGRVVNAL
jgi:purine-binding chemotaxis protein CheW